MTDAIDLSPTSIYKPALSSVLYAHLQLLQNAPILCTRPIHLYPN